MWTCIALNLHQLTVPKVWININKLNCCSSIEITRSYYGRCKHEMARLWLKVFWKDTMYLSSALLKLICAVELFCILFTLLACIFNKVHERAYFQLLKKSATYWKCCSGVRIVVKESKSKYKFPPMYTKKN